MSFNGSGVFQINSTGNPIVTATVISSTWANALTADLATGLSNVICKDGQSTVTANIPFSGFKLTGIGAPTTAGDALRFGTVVTVPNGGTGVATLTGLAKGAGTAAFVAATAGTDYVAPGTATSFTAKQTFSGSATAFALKLTNALEVETISATAANTAVIYYISGQSILYYTTNASANWTVDFRFDATPTTLASAMAVGESCTVVHKVTQGGTAYYNTQVKIDNTNTGVTTVWQGGAPAAGNINGIDVYTYEIVKTAATPTYTVFATLTQFK